MPKKGENTKATEARERKAAVKKAAVEKANKAAEDALWRDDDKHVQKKQNRKEEEERKKAEQLKKKAEVKALLENEMASIKTTGKQPLAKITRNQIQQEVENRNKNIEAINAVTKPPANRITIQDPLLEENLNRAMHDVNVATNVDEAIAVLTVKDEEEDKHPEKRMKAAYKAFEAANLDRIKLDNPTLKLSQWRQILQKEWDKSPSNPKNK